MYYSLNKSAFDKKNPQKTKRSSVVHFIALLIKEKKNPTLLVTSQEYANNFYLFAKCYET